jgi:hypothetical protein
MRPAIFGIVQLFCHCYNLLHVDDIPSEGCGALHRHMLPKYRHVAMHHYCCIAPCHQIIMGIIPSCLLHCTKRLRMIITPIAMLLRAIRSVGRKSAPWGAKKNLWLARVNPPAENSDCIVLYVRYGSIISFRYLYATLTELSIIPAV